MKRRHLIQELAISKRAALCAIVLILATFSFLQQVQATETPKADLTQMVSSLQQGGYVIVFRHGSTNRDQADTDPLNHDNIAQQRHLSDKGKEQAKQLGEVFQKLSIPLGKVYSSKFYRAIETAKLISNTDPTTTLDITEGGLVVSPNENDRRAEALRTLATTVPADKTNTLIVTHKPNIIDAFGKDWFEVKEGESSLFKPDGSTNLVPVGRFQSGDWIAAVDRM